MSQRSYVVRLLASSDCPNRIQSYPLLSWEVYWGLQMGTPFSQAPSLMFARDVDWFICRVTENDNLSKYYVKIYNT